MQTKITIPRWFDRHLHVRDGEMLKTVLPCTIEQRATGAVIMGNLKSPDHTADIPKTFRYHGRIIRVRDQYLAQRREPFLGAIFEPRMTCYLTEDLTASELIDGFMNGPWCAVKLYIAGRDGTGGTTNSAHGVKNLDACYPLFGVMERRGIPLLGHFEAVEPDVDEFDREIVSVERDLQPILKRFPGLQVVFEHITDGRAAEFVAESSYNIHATVTPHHLMINRNAMFRGGMNPISYCKPVPKREEHRKKVRSYVTSGHPRFGAGTDSAPHDEEAKSRCCGCAAGIFSALSAVELYATVFEEDNALNHLGSFLSENFVGLYGMRVSDEMMTLERTPLNIPEKVGNIRVFKGGETVPWKLVA